MLARLTLAAVFTAALTTVLASAAFAGCHCTPQSAYSVSQDRGVTVMRGNIPSNLNASAARFQNRVAAQRRADYASGIARMDARKARRARSEASSHRQTFAPQSYRREYNYNRFGYGASVSRPVFAGRSRGVRRGLGGRKGVSRPIFSTRIRS